MVLGDYFYTTLKYEFIIDISTVRTGTYDSLKSYIYYNILGKALTGQILKNQNYNNNLNYEFILLYGIV